MIATRKYKQFVQPLLNQLAENFLDGHAKIVFLFTDQEMALNGHGTLVRQIVIPDYKFPQATLYRYRVFKDNAGAFKGCSHLFYSDVDMGCVGKVKREILGDGLTVVRHPGFFGLGGWGSNNVHPESMAFVPEEARQKYFAGGFQGGKTEVYLKMCKELAANIEDDEKRGIIAEHNDESHMNHYLVAHPDIPRIELDSGYCMVESVYLRENWKIDHLPVKIIALDKNHAEMRS